MEQILSIIQATLPVFLALGLGMLCRSKKLLTPEGVEGLKKVVLNITLPVVLLNAFATTVYTPKTLLIPVVIFLLNLLAMGLGKVGMGIFGQKSKITPFFTTGFEAGMIGYALFAVAFPKESSSQFAILDLGQTIFVFTLYKALLSGKGSGKAMLRDAVTSPILWAVFAGILIGATGLYQTMANTGIAPVFHSITDFISAPTAMIILLTIGYDLVPSEIPWRQVAGLVFLRLAVMAVCLLVLTALNQFVLGGIIFMGAAVLFFILPPPYVLPVFCTDPEERVKFSSAISAFTLVSIILFAVLCAVI